MQLLRSEVEPRLTGAAGDLSPASRSSSPPSGERRPAAVPWLWLTVALLGSPAAADSFYTVTPCRVLDTRTTSSPVQANTPTVFAVGGLCGIPPVASSVSFNVTLVAQNIFVDLGMGPGDAVAPPPTNVVSSSQQHPVIAGAGVIPLSADGQGTVQVLANSTSSGSTDLTLDVNGYFLSSSPGGLAQLYAQGGDGDPGTATDPLLDPLPDNTLGQTPAGFAAVEPPINTPPSLITPLRYDRATRRYFNYNGTVTPLIGVSADVACHLHGGNGYDMCTFSPGVNANYKNVLLDAAAKGLNKIRLWVNINGGNWQANANCVAEPPDPNDQPFKYYPPGSPGFPANAPPDGIGYWNLDERNATFFANLQTVVGFASLNHLFVEVTFFAPWIGQWELSPWNPNHGRLSTDPTHTTQVGFTNRGYFVQPDPSNGGNNPNEALRTYQRNVIDWTIDALDAPPSTVNSGLPFDKVYFEIANEPENGNPRAPNPSCGDTMIPITALASGVTSWQQTMITEAGTYEANHYVTPNGNLAFGHLISVQPFTQAGTTPYLPAGGSGVTVINGHYTAVAAIAEGKGALGAITMARTYAGFSGPLIMASNEDKISGDTSMFLPWGGSGETCGWEAPTHDPFGRNTGPAGVDCEGEADSARAGAWEFMFDLGGGFDHFGYYWNSDFGRLIRSQLGQLQKFLAGLPLRQLKTSADPKQGAGPTWINIGASPYSNPNNQTKYWAALEPTPTGVLTYVLYIHHSVARRTAFGGYQPIYSVSPTNPQYVERRSLCLALQTQHYQVQWIDPASGRILSSSKIPGNGGCGSSGWNITSPTYSYDIALEITQVP
jgi:hypothetical protein